MSNSWQFFIFMSFQRQKFQDFSHLEQGQMTSDIFWRTFRIFWIHNEVKSGTFLYSFVLPRFIMIWCKWTFVCFSKQKKLNEYWNSLLRSSPKFKIYTEIVKFTTNNFWIEIYFKLTVKIIMKKMVRYFAIMW